MATKTIRVGGELEEALEKESSARGITVGTLIRNILNQWMMEHQWKRKVGRPQRVLTGEE